MNNLKQKIIDAIKLLYKRDGDLFTRNNYEVTISCKLSQYLFTSFSDYDVDCEYDKHINNPKYISELNTKIRPDIIIHKRNNDNNNLACIEIKKQTNNENRNHDFQKLKAMTSQQGEYGYELGIFIDFGKSLEDITIVYFSDGKMESEQ